MSQPNISPAECLCILNRPALPEWTAHDCPIHGTGRTTRAAEPNEVQTNFCTCSHHWKMHQPNPEADWYCSVQNCDCGAYEQVVAVALSSQPPAAPGAGADLFSARMVPLRMKATTKCEQSSGRLFSESAWPPWNSSRRGYANLCIMTALTARAMFAMNMLSGAILLPPWRTSSTQKARSRRHDRPPRTQEGPGRDDAPPEHLQSREGCAFEARQLEEQGSWSSATSE